MVESGFQRITLSARTTVYWSGTPELHAWVRNTVDIVRGASRALLSRGLATVSEVETGIGDLLGLLERRDASSWFYFNQAVALV